jgi:hypothetical protein
MNNRSHARSNELTGPCRPWSVFLLSLLLFVMSGPRTARAELILGAEARISYEDNVVGLLSESRGPKSSNTGGGTLSGMAMKPGGMGSGKTPYTGVNGQSPSDVSLTLSGEAGAFTDIGTSSSIYAKGIAQNTSYDQYKDLDFTIVGVNAGVSTRWTDMYSTRFSAVGKLKRFSDDLRDSTSYGGAISLKEQLSRDLWLRETIEFEKNDARSSDFSYTGLTFSVRGGYFITKRTLLTAGVSYLVQKYDVANASTFTADTFSIGAEQEITKRWSAGVDLDLQASRFSGDPDTVNNILSFAIRYNY